MKKLLVVMLILGMASVANAALWLTVNGGTDEVTLVEGDTADVNVWGDGASPRAYYWLGVMAGGLGELSIGDATVLYLGDIKYVELSDDTDVADALGTNVPNVGMMLTDPNSNTPHPYALDGLLVEHITFTCTGVGEEDPDVTIALFDMDAAPIEGGTFVIHQIPEPMTMALLGLGGLFLRRRK